MLFIVWRRKADTIEPKELAGGAILGTSTRTKRMKKMTERSCPRPVTGIFNSTLHPGFNNNRDSLNNNPNNMWGTLVGRVHGI